MRFCSIWARTGPEASGDAAVLIAAFKAIVGQ